MKWFISKDFRRNGDPGDPLRAPPVRSPLAEEEGPQSSIVIPIRRAAFPKRPILFAGIENAAALNQPIAD